MNQHLALDSLIGQRISWASHGANMRQFGFGHVGTKTSEDTWTLHIQCSWRLRNSSSIVTGSFDWYEPAETVPDQDEDWDPAYGGSLQEKNLRDIFQDESSGGLIVNNTEALVVESFEQDEFGGVALNLTSGITLEIFPAGTRGEYWRLFLRGDLSSHYVSEAR